MFERMLLSGTAGGKGNGKKLGLFNRPILASDGGVDWYGEITGEELVTGEELTELIGLTFGTLLNADPGWLLVGIDGKQLAIAKKPLRNYIHWNAINAVGAAYGEKVLTLKGQDWKVRLPKSLDKNVEININASGLDLEQFINSEYNRIFYRLLGLETFQDSTLRPYTKVANYNRSDIGISPGHGGWVLCQERSGGNHVLRGYYEPSYGKWHGISGSYSSSGWRPVLELV